MDQIKKFLKIETGMSLKEVNEILENDLIIEKRREEHFKSDIAHFEDIGLWLFFKPDTGILDTIKYEDPFPLLIDGVSIGDTKAQVKKLKGRAPKVDPFPTQEDTIWIYGKMGNKDWIRFDFEKKRDGKCIQIFK